MKEMYMLQRAKEAESEAMKQSDVMRQRQRPMEHSDQGGKQQRKQELKGRNDNRGVEFHVQVILGNVCLYYLFFIIQLENYRRCSAEYYKRVNF